MNIVCPNCNANVAFTSYCANCKAPLGVAAQVFAQREYAMAAAGPAEAPGSAPAAVAPTPAGFSALLAAGAIRQDLEVSVADTDSLTETEANVKVNMDPRLQRAVLRKRQGISALATASTDLDEIAVVASVTDVTAWEQLSEVRVGSVIYGEQGEAAVVTGRVPISRIEAVRQQPFVVSMKASQRLSPRLVKTVEEMQARPDLLPAGNVADGGRGVIVGIVDFGCDFAHQNFRNADGSTRILGLWDQTGSLQAGGAVSYGRLYSKADIDAALRQPNPYAALGYEPPPDTLREKGTHGTHVTDIAAGNGRGSGAPGVAPNADIIFVEVSASDIPWSGPDAVSKSFGDSVQLLEALEFIFRTAGSRPCVINVSLGTNGGPHDGTTLVEQGIDRLIRAAPNRAVVIAASNSFADGIHAAGTVAANGSSDVVWEIQAGDTTNNELEMWYPGASRLAIELIAPNGKSLVTVEPGQQRTMNSQTGETVLFVANRLNDPNNHDNMIGVFMERSLPAGNWIMRLHSRSAGNTQFHAWLERDDSGQSSFSPPQDNSHSIGSISCGQLTLVVGSYDAHKATTPLSWFSSAGPTRDGRRKPEVSGPGHDVLAAHSRTGTGTVRKSGTSMASPAVAGMVALALGEALRHNLALSADEIRNVVIQTARASGAAAGWEARYGNGRVSARDVVARVAAMAAAHAGAPPVARVTRGASPAAPGSAVTPPQATPPMPPSAGGTAASPDGPPH